MTPPTSFVPATSIYIHIPFCRHACAYCDFYFLVTKKEEDAFFKALQKEISYYTARGKVDFFQLKSIYLGGGTPSFASPHHIQEVLTYIQHIAQSINPSFSLQPLEITLEANPEDLTPERLHHYQAMGINRISLGVQSFRATDLNYLGRHTTDRSLDILQTLQSWERWSLDLIYGLPTLSDGDWEEQLAKALSFSPPHLSLYGLTVEDGTPLAHKIHSHRKTPPSEAQMAKQFCFASEYLERAGYEHYEISNYALKNISSPDSIHNTSYWSGDSYLGLGPAAHSYDGVQRFKNVSNLKKYLLINDVLDNVVEDFKNLPLPPLSSLPSIETYETLTTTERFNETIMLSLRTSQGCDLNHIEKQFGLERKQRLLKKAEPHLGKTLNIEQSRLKANLSGKVFIDRITTDLFEEID